MSERDPKQSLWHQTLLKYQGTSPEIDGQIKANKLAFEAAKALTETGNETPQFYFNAAAKFVEAHYYSPLMLSEVTNFRPPFHPDNIISKYLAVSPSDIAAGTQFHSVNGVREETECPPENCFDGYSSADFIRTCLVLQHGLRRESNAPELVFTFVDRFLQWFKEEFEARCDKRLKCILIDAAKQQIEVDQVKMLVVVAWDAASCNAYMATKDKPQFALRFETLLEQDPKCLHLYLRLASCHGVVLQFKEECQIAQKGIKIAEETQSDYHCAHLLEHLLKAISYGGLGGSTFKFGVLLSVAEKGNAKINSAKHWLPKTVVAVIKEVFDLILEAEDIFGRDGSVKVVPTDCCIEDDGTPGVKFCDPASCSVCENTVIKMKKCACGNKRYCSKECQAKDWPTHKKECPCRKKKDPPEVKSKK